MIIEEESTSCPKKMMILTFNYSIVLRGMIIRRLMKDSCLDIREIRSAKIVSMALSLHITRIEILKLGLNISIKILKYRKQFCIKNKHVHRVVINERTKY